MFLAILLAFSLALSTQARDNRGNLYDTGPATNHFKGISVKANQPIAAAFSFPRTFEPVIFKNAIINLALQAGGESTNVTVRLCPSQTTTGLPFTSYHAYGLNHDNCFESHTFILAPNRPFYRVEMRATRRTLLKPYTIYYIVCERTESIRELRWLNGVQPAVAIAANLGEGWMLGKADSYAAGSPRVAINALTKPTVALAYHSISNSVFVNDESRNSLVVAHHCLCCVNQDVPPLPISPLTTSPIIDTGRLPEPLTGTKFFKGQSLAVAFIVRSFPHAITFSNVNVTVHTRDIVNHRPTSLTMRLCKADHTGLLPKHVYTSQYTYQLDCIDSRHYPHLDNSLVRKVGWRSHIQPQLDFNSVYFIVLESDAENEETAPMWISSRDSAALTAISRNGEWMTDPQYVGAPGAYGLQVEASMYFSNYRPVMSTKKERLAEERRAEQERRKGFTRLRDLEQARALQDKARFELSIEHDRMREQARSAEQERRRVVATARDHDRLLKQREQEWRRIEEGAILGDQRNETQGHLKVVPRRNEQMLHYFEMKRNVLKMEEALANSRKRRQARRQEERMQALKQGHGTTMNQAASGKKE